jgi:hypothetical protein
MDNAQLSPHEAFLVLTAVEVSSALLMSLQIFKAVPFEEGTR